MKSRMRLLLSAVIAVILYRILYMIIMLSVREILGQIMTCIR